MLLVVRSLLWPFLTFFRQYPLGLLRFLDILQPGTYRRRDQLDKAATRKLGSLHPKINLRNSSQHGQAIGDAPLILRLLLLEPVLVWYTE